MVLNNPQNRANLYGQNEMVSGLIYFPWAIKTDNDLSSFSVIHGNFEEFYIHVCIVMHAVIAV